LTQGQRTYAPEKAIAGARINWIYWNIHDPIGGRIEADANRLCRVGLINLISFPILRVEF
jgi:hypothetical protein